jgi:hypothetical protein
MSRRFGVVHDGIQKSKHEETMKAVDHTMVFPPEGELARLDATLPAWSSPCRSSFRW